MLTVKPRLVPLVLSVIFALATAAPAALDRPVEPVREPPAPAVEKPGDVTLEVPKMVAAGAEFPVGWAGPDGRGDYVSIVPPGARAEEYGRYAYTRGGTPLILLAPERAGVYEVRYFFRYRGTILAIVPVTVTPVTAVVSPPAEVAAGAEFMLAWEGPANKGDYLTIVPAGTAEKNYGTYAYARNNNPSRLRAPEEPGAYEIRYILGQSNETLARGAITVTAVSPPVEVE